LLRDCGRISKYEHAVIGYNSRLDTLQAAILRVKLKRLKRWNRMRQKAAGEYGRRLEGVVKPVAASGRSHIYHAYSIRVPQRDEVFASLKKNGIGAAIYYPIPLHLQPAYAQLGYRKGDFPVAEKACEEIISLPIFPHIRPGQISFVAKTIRSALQR